MSKTLDLVFMGKRAETLEAWEQLVLLLAERVEKIVQPDPEGYKGTLEQYVENVLRLFELRFRLLQNSRAIRIDLDKHENWRILRDQIDRLGEHASSICSYRLGEDFRELLRNRLRGVIL